MATEAPRRICIYGAGAIGTVLGTWLARAGHDTTFIARGAQFDAFRSDGATVVVDGDAFAAAPRVAAAPEEAGTQDLVLLTVKATALPQVVPRLAPLLGPDTVIATVMNGLPWWLFAEPGDDGGMRPVAGCLDPDGSLSAATPRDRMLACVISMGATLKRPGRVEQSRSHLLELGEADGTISGRLQAVVDVLKGAGLNANPSRDIHAAHWKKLLGNASFGPISVLTGATNGAIGDDPAIRELCGRIMREVERLGIALGWCGEVEVEKRIAIGARLRDHRTSMLQDFLAGRPLEIDSIVTPVVELGRRAGVPVPATETAWALLRQKLALAAAARA